MLRDKINENNFKTPFNKAKAAIYARGKRKGKSEKAIEQDIQNYFAKLAAISDINKERSIRHMNKHDQLFNNVINDETFDIDFRELDDYDSYYDDFSRNNKPVEGGREYYGWFGYSGEKYESVRHNMNRKDRVLLESLTKKYGRRNIINELHKREK